MNNYPFLDNKLRPIFTSELGDITPRVRPERLIDISNSPLVLATSLRSKLENLHEAGELDGGLPIVRNNILVGLIPAPDLEFALDKLENEDETLCFVTSPNTTRDHWRDVEDEGESDPTDLTSCTDPVSQISPLQWFTGWLTTLVGSCCARHTFTNGPCVPMLCKTGFAIHLCYERWQTCWLGA